MFVKDFMSRDLITASAEERAGPVLQRMREEGLRRLPVLNREGRLVGIVTDRRLLQALTVPTRRGRERPGDQPQSALTVAALMNPHPVTVPPDTPLEVAASIMAEQRIGSLVVMEGERPVGIITETDMFRVFLRLLISEEPGLRVTARAPAFRGILADIATELARAGGYLLSLGTLKEDDSFLVAFKVADVTRADLEDILRELPLEDIDIRKA